MLRRFERLFVMLITGASGGCALGDLPAERHPDLPLEAVQVFETPEGLCSAVAVEPHLWMTARHCGTLGSIGGRLVRGAWVSPDNDIEVLGTIPAAHVTARVQAGDSPSAGRWLVGFGCDFRTGRAVRRVRRAWYVGLTVDGEFALRGNICFGDSGGAVFDDAGLLVGVISSAMVGESQQSEHIISVPAAFALNGLR